jgi:hypothetical protein
MSKFKVPADQSPLSLLPRWHLAGYVLWEEGTLCPYMAEEQKKNSPHKPSYSTINELMRTKLS